jgi:hypothetical protein
LKSNAQLRFEGQGKAPQPAPAQDDQHAATSLSQTAPLLLLYDAGYPQIMAALSSIQREAISISVRVEQCQLDIQECLKHHHPSQNDKD